VREPGVLAAVSPHYGVQFFLNNGFAGVLVLGSVFLVVTGGEALYADMGHFGKRPIQLAWFSMVLPALLLNYFGQGALLLSSPQAVDNPFYRLAPEWATIPLVILSTLATVIASQALISGAFSLSQQALHMGYLPRLRVLYTSESQVGQVYIPGVNWALMVACIGLVLGFRTSGNLAAAYGAAVSTDMVITTLLFYAVARERFRWSRGPTFALCAGFLLVDLAFFSGNIFKIPDGGWFPLVVGTLVYTLMTTWRRGRALVARRMHTGEVALAAFLKDLDPDIPRVPGTAYHLTARRGSVPASLIVNLRHNNALHEHVVLLHVDVEMKPHVPPARRATIARHEHGFAEVTLHYGFRDRIDVPRALQERVLHRKGFVEEDITYMIGHEVVYATARPGMPVWRERLFSLLNRNAPNVIELFRLPYERVIEIGSPVDI
jgi:KUP system potassium uptake protein